MLFFVNRKIFNSLNSELQEQYISDNIIAEYGDIKHLDKITKEVHRIIANNEKWHNRYGVLQKNGMIQCQEDSMVPAWSGQTGYAQIYDIVVCPFDWSWEDNGDFNYCFFLASTIKEKDQ